MTTAVRAFDSPSLMLSVVGDSVMPVTSTSPLLGTCTLTDIFTSGLARDAAVSVTIPH